MTQIPSCRLDGKAALEEMGWLQPGSLALENPAAETSSGQPLSWDSGCSQSVSPVAGRGVSDWARGPRPDYEQTALGRPGSHQAGRLGQGLWDIAWTRQKPLGWLSMWCPNLPTNQLPCSLMHSFWKLSYARCSFALGSLRLVPLSCHPGCTLQYGRCKQLKCSWSELRHALRVKCTPDSKHLALWICVYMCVYRYIYI